MFNPNTYKLARNNLNNGRSSAAMTPGFTRGGIDFAQSNLSMLIKRDGAGVPLPMSQQNLDNIHIDGLVPFIINIKPITGMTLFNEEAENE